MAFTLAAAIRPNMQGLLLTCEAIAFFILAMVLMPRLKPTGGHTGPTDAATPPITAPRAAAA